MTARENNDAGADTVLRALDLMADRNASELPAVFAQWLDRILGADANPKERRRLQSRLITYAEYCRAILLTCTGKLRCGDLDWQFPQFKVPLDWLDDSSATPAGADLFRAVKDWICSRQYQQTTDLLRSVYEHLIPQKVRGRFGEHYTPQWLCDHVVNQVWSKGCRWLDPSAGAGAFSLALHRKSREQGEEPEFVGIDCNPWAVLAAAANTAWSRASSRLGPVPDFKIPIAFADVVTDADLSGLGSFNRIIGNPPWIVWDRLPEEYRLRSVDIWKRYCLFTETGMSSILGGGKKDLSMLVTYAAVDQFLADGGKLGLVITRSVFSAAGSARGFRRWALPDGTPLRVDSVDDLSDQKPFPGVNAKACVLFASRGEPTQYPVPYYVWTSKDRHSRQRELAQPSESSDPLSSWSHVSEAGRVNLEKILGKCDYRAHLGVNTGGANGVFWMRRLAIADEDCWEMQNLADRTRSTLPTVQTILESRMLFPVLLGKDVRAWFARPSAWLLMVQDVDRRQGICPSQLQENCPRTFAYLSQFESLLRQRAAFQRYFLTNRNGRSVDRAPFYSMFDVGTYTTAPFKVVWNRMGRVLAAAVVTDWEGRLVLPQETHCLFGVESEAEAHYLSALLNSSWAQSALEATAQVGGKSFATPRAIHRLGLKRFDRQNDLHQAIAETGQAAQTQTVLTGSPHPETLAAVENLTAQYWQL